MQRILIGVLAVLTIAGCGGGSGGGDVSLSLAQGAGADTGEETALADATWEGLGKPPAARWRLVAADGARRDGGEVAWSGRRAHVAGRLPAADAGTTLRLEIAGSDGRTLAVGDILATATPPPVLQAQRDPAIVDGHGVVGGDGAVVLHLALINRHRDGEALRDVGWEVRDEAGGVLVTGVLAELPAASGAAADAGAIPLTRLAIPLGRLAPGRHAVLFALDPARRFVPEYCRFNNLRRMVVEVAEGAAPDTHVHRYRFGAALHGGVAAVDAGPGRGWRVVRCDDGAIVAEGAATVPTAVGVVLGKDGDGEVDYLFEVREGVRVRSSCTVVADWTPTGSG